MTTETISGDDIVPCDECGEPKPRARYHTAHDCVRYLRRQIVKKDDALRLAHARLANVNARTANGSWADVPRHGASRAPAPIV